MIAVTAFLSPLLLTRKMVPPRMAWPPPRFSSNRSKKFPRREGLPASLAELTGEVIGELAEFKEIRCRYERAVFRTGQARGTTLRIAGACASAGDKLRLTTRLVHRADGSVI